MAMLGLLLLAVACGRYGYDPTAAGAGSAAGATSVGGDAAAAGVRLGQGGGGGIGSIAGGRSASGNSAVLGGAAGAATDTVGGALVGGGGTNSTDIAGGGLLIGVGGVTSIGGSTGSAAGGTAASSSGATAAGSASSGGSGIGGSGGTGIGGTGIGGTGIGGTGIGGVAGGNCTAGSAGAKLCSSTSEVCDGIDNDCNGLRDDVSGLGQLCPATSACVAGTCQTLDSTCLGYQWSNHAYAYCEPAVVVEFATAEAACVAMGGHVVTIGSAEEDAAMRSLVTNKIDIWIGLTRGTDCQWKWVTGELTSYLGWSAGYPDGACGTFDCCMLWGKSSGNWDDTRCNSGRNYVCEWEN